TWHLGAPARRLADDGIVSYIPARASSVPALLAAWTPDVALIRVSPPDARGWCSLGPGLSYVPALVRAARCVVAEVDPNLPRPCGEADVHVDEIAVRPDAEDGGAAYPSRDLSAAPTTAAIAGHIVPLLPADPTIQIGIGAIPEAVVSALIDVRANG